MKTRTKLIVIFLLLTGGVLFSQPQKNYLFKLGDTEIGGYVGMNTKVTGLGTKTAGFLDFRGAVTINSHWAIGLNVSGLYYDKKLDELVADGTYHIYSTYGGIFVEHFWDLSEDFKLSASLLMGEGFVNYQYDKDYRANKEWYERKIDEDFFHLFEPQLEIQYNFSNLWWVGLNTSYRSVSPIQLRGADDNMLSKFSTGLTLKYGLF